MVLATKGYSQLYTRRIIDIDERIKHLKWFNFIKRRKLLKERYIIVMAGWNDRLDLLISDGIIGRNGELF